MDCTNELAKFIYKLRALWWGGVVLLHVSCVNDICNEDLYRRTVLVYMGGDNNLSSETDAKLAALSSGWNHPDCSLIVYQDKREGPRLLEITNAGTKVIRTYSTENSAAKEVLERVVREVKERYPARGYGLLVFSHGTGWLPQGMYLRPRTIIADGKNEMEITDFARALDGTHFEFIIFEACLMAGVEVAWELRNRTDYVVASAAEILSPGFTNIYPDMRESLFLPIADLQALARTYYEYYNRQSGLYRSATISVLRTSALCALVDAARPILANDKSVDPLSVAYFDGTNTGVHLYADFADYLRLKSDDSQQYALVDRALSQAVVYRAATPNFLGRKLTAHSGLSIYIPRSAYPELNESYRQTAWYLSVHSSVVH